MKRNVILSIITLLIIGGIAYFILFSGDEHEPAFTQPNNPSSVARPESSADRLSPDSSRSYEKSSIEKLVSDIKDKGSLDEAELRAVQSQTDLKNEIATPAPKSEIYYEELAIPTMVAKRNNYDIRTFELRAEEGKISPAVIVVNEGDVLDLFFTAMDKAYRIAFPNFGVQRILVPGERTRLQFGARPTGQYYLVCEEGCKGANRIVGALLVNSKLPL